MPVSSEPVLLMAYLAIGLDVAFVPLFESEATASSCVTLPGGRWVKLMASSEEKDYP